ncbi:MAG: hypothetical protein LBU45_04870 [Azoarcus sp.]|jgi:hypothetical protein|nr:hypothetical protein [Azoarcus sp.]
MASTIPVSSYQTLAREISVLEPLAGAGRLEEAAGVMSALAARLEELPAARESDRAAIEHALARLAALDERLRPLCCGDTGRLLSVPLSARRSLRME